MNKQIEAKYTRHASRYDTIEKIYRLFGFREEHYRRIAIDALNLREGDTVVDLGCGTGKNFAQIIDQIGPKGHLIGVDLTSAMLEQAQHKIDKRNWSNISLFHMNMSEFIFPAEVDAVVSIFALSFSDSYRTVIQNSTTSLRTGECLVVADMRWSNSVPT